MISPAGCCHYRVVLGRSAPGVLGGRAERNSDPDRHGWHLYLVRARRSGLPGRLSQQAVAKEHPPLTRDIVVHSTPRMKMKLL